MNIQSALTGGLSAAVALVAFTVVGSAQNPEGRRVPLAGRELVFQLEGDWAQLDFTKVGVGNQGGIILNYVYDKLVTYGPDPKTGELALLPYVATKWVQKPESITFTVREDVVCADGSRLTPTAIKNSYERAFEKAPEAVSLWGAGNKTIIADDKANTVTFNFATPNGLAIHGFADNRQGIICPSGLANPDNLATTPAGSGPYALVEAIHGQHLVLRKRPEWSWGPNGVTAKNLPDKVTLQIVNNPSTAATLVINSQLHLAAVALDDVARVKAAGNLVNKTSITALSDIMTYNHVAGRPTSDPKVREALSVAINMDQWAQASGRVPTTSFLSKRSECFDPTTADLMPKNTGPAAARKVLTDAGYTAGSNGMLTKNGVPLTVVLVSYTGGFRLGPDYLVAQWRSAGINVEARVTDFATFLAALRAGNFDALTAVYPFDSPNPGTYVYTFAGPSPTQGGTNYSSVDNDEALKAIVAARASVGGESCKQWSIVQRSFLQHYNLWPIGNQKRDWFSVGIDFFPASLLPDVRFMSGIAK